MLPTEPIGSIPRPLDLIEGTHTFEKGEISLADLDALRVKALRETIAEFESTGSPVISDGEQTKPSFVGYPLSGVKNLAGDGVVIPFADGHTRQLPRLTGGPFRYGMYSGSFTSEAKTIATRPIKQAVIACSALSLLYPADGVEGYSQADFIADLSNEAEKDIRSAFAAGAHCVQIDFTEGRLSCKLDPSKGLLRQFVAVNNSVLERFSAEERHRIGIHTCPGGDQNSTHSADVDYAELLPDLFLTKVGNFYVQLASEPDRPRVLEIIRETIRPDQKVFVGVIDPINNAVESPEEVRDRILEAAEFIPLSQLGTTDDCGFSPFGDDIAMARSVAFDKIRSRIEGTKMASAELGV